MSIFYPSSKYIFAGDQRIAFKEGSTVTYVHPDHLGSSSVLTKGADGTKDEQLTYFPFGQTRTDTDGAGNPVSPGFRYKYTDQEFDSTTGLYYYKARYYDPVLGRFVQPDAIVPVMSNPQGWNRYAYVRNNPLRYVDPSGYQELTETELELTGSYGYCPACYALSQPAANAPLPPRLDVGVGPSTTHYTGTLGTGVTAYTSPYFQQDPSQFAALPSTQQGLLARPGQSVTLFGVPVEIGVSVTFASVSYGLGILPFGIQRPETVFPPSLGFGVDIQFNKPSGQYTNAFIGPGKNLQIGTFLYNNPNFGANDPQAILQQGLRIGIGPSLGLPFGISAPTPP